MQDKLPPISGIMLTKDRLNNSAMATPQRRFMSEIDSEILDLVQTLQPASAPPKSAIMQPHPPATPPPSAPRFTTPAPHGFHGYGAY